MKQKHRPLTLQPLLRTRSCFSLQRVSKGGSISSFACSTSKFHGGRVGFNSNREGKSLFLKFGVDESESVVGGGGDGDVGERDWSQILSALLPFVVAVTAVAALSQPSTFTWWGSLIFFACLWFLFLLFIN